MDIVSKIDNQSQEDVSNTPETIFVLTNFKKYFGNKRPTPEEYIYIITKKTKAKL